MAFNILSNISEMDADTFENDDDASPVCRPESARKKLRKEQLWQWHLMPLVRHFQNSRSSSPDCLSESPSCEPIESNGTGCFRKKKNLMKCQNPDCVEKPQAIKVCHHSDCQEQNNQRPLMLCSDCDSHIHSTAQGLSGHLRFDLLRKGNNSLNRNVSTRSLPGLSSSRDIGSDEEGEEEDNADTAEDGCQDNQPTSKSQRDDLQKKQRLRRKKVLKGRRYHTDERSHSKGNHSRSQSYTGEERSYDQSQDTYSLTDNCLPNPNFPNYSPNYLSVSPIPGYETFGGRISPFCTIGEKDEEQEYCEDGKSDEVSLQLSQEGLPNPEDFYTKEEMQFVKLKRLRDLVDEERIKPDHSVTSDKRFRGDKVLLSRKVSAPAWATTSQRRELEDKEIISRKFSLGTEYFTLKFDVLEEPEIEIIQAVKGKSLREAIRSVVERKDLYLERIHVFLTSSNTPLPLDVDCFPLGGNHLHIRAKDGESPFRSSSMYQKAHPGSANGSVRPKQPSQRDRDRRQQPGSQRQKKSLQAPEDSNLSDTSPHGTLTGSDVQKVRGLKAQSKLSTFFSPFTKSQEKQEQLTEILNGYSINGLPPMPELVTLGHKQFPDSTFFIEKHWTDVVSGAENLSKKEKDQQERIWELLSTEVDYIQKLKVIANVFVCCLLNLQNEQILNEIESDKLFSNVADIQQVNCEFWATYMSKTLQEARDTKTLLNPSHMKEGFLQFEELFLPYTKYCLEQKASQDYLKAKDHDSELFRLFVAWAENQKQCDRLKLADLIVKPMQRLTRYKLLLTAILKATDNEEQRKDLVQMVDHVERFVLQVNTVMHQRAEQARLSMIINRIESYDIIDVTNEECQKLVNEFSRLDLTTPIPGCGPHQRRHLLREGPLRIKDATKMDVYCFLFTDLFLITKPTTKRGDKVKVIRPPMRLDKIVVHSLRDSVSFLMVYLNEYHVASAVYTFHGDASRSWVDKIKHAQEAYRQMRNAAMERPESRLMYIDMGDDDDEYSAMFNSQGHYDYSPDQFYRLDSSSSVENFMPNLSILRTSSQETLSKLSVPEDRHSMLTASASLDETVSDRLSQSPKRPRSATFVETGRPRSPRPPLTPSRKAFEADETDFRFLSPNMANVSPGRSPPESPKFNHQVTIEDGYLIGHTVSGKPIIRTDSNSSNEGVPVKIASDSQGSKIYVLPNRPDMGAVSTDEHQRRLNQRRTSRHEKRYHTADAIQDMRKDLRDRDTTIHKRLSWNFGTVDINIEGSDKSGVLKHKTFSSDSLRSMPSSSGVSSTGSLHLSPESEICEEYEVEVPSISQLRHASGQYQFLGQSSLEVEPSVSRCSSVNGAHSVSLLEPARSMDDPGSSGEKLTVQNRAVSKSMPDISNLSINVTQGDVQDGIGSVQLPHLQQSEEERRKMSHAQILRMKKQLLLNSTTEASEV